MKNAELSIAQTRILPDEGDVIGWKKAHSADGNPLIVKLRIPGEAKRSHAMGRKCRAEYAEVLAISDNADEAFSQWDSTFRYAAGETVRTSLPFDEDMWNECASGIHFYITRQEAVDHV